MFGHFQVVLDFWPLSSIFNDAPNRGPTGSKLCIGILNITDHPFHSYIFGPHVGVAVF